MSFKDRIGSLTNSLRPPFHRDPVFSSTRTSLFFLYHFTSFSALILLLYFKLQSPPLVSASVVTPTIDQFESLHNSKNNIQCSCSNLVIDAIAFLPQNISDLIKQQISDSQQQCYNTYDSSSPTPWDIVALDMCANVLSDADQLLKTFNPPNWRLYAPDEFQSVLRNQIYISAYQGFSYYQRAVLSDIRLASLTSNCTGIACSVFNTEEARGNLSANMTALFQTLVQPTLDFSTAFAQILYPLYFTNCNVKLCTWVEPESLAQSFLSVLAIVSALHTVGQRVCTVFYFWLEDKKWHKDVEDVVKFQVQKSRSEFPLDEIVN